MLDVEHGRGAPSEAIAETFDRYVEPSIVTEHAAVRDGPNVSNTGAGDGLEPLTSSLSTALGSGYAAGLASRRSLYAPRGGFASVPLKARHNES